MAALVSVRVQVDGGAVGHLGPGAGILISDHGGGLVGVALHELMLEALDVQGDLCVAPLLPDEVGHLVAGLAAVHAVGRKAQVGGHLTDDVAHHRRRQNGGVVRPGVVGVVQHDVDQNLRIIRRENRRKGGHFLVVAVGAAVHVQLLGRTGLAADAVARHVGAAATALSAVRHFVFHDLADGVAGALADDLTADVGTDLLNDVAVLVGDLIHHMGGDEVAAVDGCRNGGADLQRRDRHGLTERRGSELDFAQLAGVVVLHKVGLVGQIHARPLGEAERVKVIVEEAGAHPLAQLDEVDVAAVPQGHGQILHAMGLFAGAVVGLLGNGVGTGAVQGGVEGGMARVQPHGRRDDLKDASGVVQLGDGLVLPLDITVIARVIAFRVQNLIAPLIGDVVAILIFLIDAVELRLRVDQFIQISQVLAVIQRVIGVKIRLGGHGQNGTRLDVHHDGGATVLDIVGFDGLVQIPLHHFLDIDIQREDEVGAVLGFVSGGVLVGNGVAIGIAERDGAAIHTGQRGFIGFFEAISTVAVGIAEAQHRGRKGTIGVIPLEALGGGDRDAALADAFFGVGFFVGLVVLRDVFFNGELDGVVDLGGQHLIGRIVLGEGVVHRLILGLVGFRRRIHAVQRRAIAREQPQGDLGAHLIEGSGVDGLGHHLGVVVRLAGEESAAVAGVGPDGPYHAGGCQRDARGIVDLAAGGLNRAVQQLLLGGVLAVLGTIPDLDVI